MLMVVNQVDQNFLLMKSWVYDEDTMCEEGVGSCKFQITQVKNPAQRFGYDSCI